MSRLTSALLHTWDNREKQNMVWNMIGSFFYAMASMVLAFLVMRIAGEEQGGIFSFGFSTFGQQMFIIAYFGIRPFQVTDGENQYSFGDYLSHRVLTSLAAVAAGLVFLGVQTVLGNYSADKSAILFLLVLYKVIDGFADVYESEFQRNGNLHLTGKSNTFRTILSVFCFLVSLTLGGSLFLSCIIAVSAQAAGFLLFDACVIKELGGIEWSRTSGHSKAIFHSTSLLFLSAFLDFYIFSASKYAIDANMTDAYSGYFNIIFMPTSVINLVAGFVIRPFLTSLTNFWNQRNYSDFKNQCSQLFRVIAALTVLAVTATVLFGKPVLGLLEMILGNAYEGSLMQYHESFVVIVLGGGFYAMLSLMYYSLVIMRRQGSIFLVYSIAAVVAVLCSNSLVSAYGIWGAALAYLGVMMVLAVGFAFLVIYFFRKEKLYYGR